jgi:hypothetical protein
VVKTKNGRWDGLVAHGGRIKIFKFLIKNFMGRCHVEYLIADGRIIPKWLRGNWDVMADLCQDRAQWRTLANTAVDIWTS